jgi:hypothetical protein
MWNANFIRLEGCEMKDFNGPIKKTIPGLSPPEVLTVVIGTFNCKIWDKQDHEVDFKSLFSRV